MGSWFSRRDFLPAGLKTDQIALDGNRIRVHARSLDASAAYAPCSRFPIAACAPGGGARPAGGSARTWCFSPILPPATSSP
ncbi:hypothetical protein CKO19_12260 [Rhodovulum adriaticum]|nr:hypothetical protein [Rhodovulum adriaticum]